VEVRFLQEQRTRGYGDLFEAFVCWSEHRMRREYWQALHEESERLWRSFGMTTRSILARKSLDRFLFGVCGEFILNDRHSRVDATEVSMRVSHKLYGFSSCLFGLFIIPAI